ncbi:MAG: enoyl-CoA hydratase/isomerase family protein [Acidimicrobiales bacterium]|nr:enoyl-CoA hydratase/isomerase family protein [Acidimicrobiales bacterium]
MYREVLYEVDDPVATITLNRPEVLNAWTPTMEMEVRDALARAVADPAVVGIVLTGAGRGFCAGVDLTMLEAYAAGDRDVLVAEEVALPGEAWSEDLRGPYSFLMSLPKPVVAAINGPVVGLALAIVLACDLRFMAEDAHLATTFAERGLVAEYGLGWLLPRMVGPTVAMDLLFSARPVRSSEAVALGLANRSLPPDELLSAARAYIVDLAARCSPASLAVMKRQVYTHLHAGLREAELESRRLMLASFERPDAAEGVRSFVKKRPPRFARLGTTTGG